MIRLVALLACLAAVVSCSSTSRGPETAPQINLTPGPTTSQALFDAIAAHDRALFGALFDRCDVDAIEDLVTDDFEFYHDKWGLTATTGAQFVESIRKLCERQQQGIDFRARRELVAGSMAVYPLNKYGAVVGVHRFYARVEGKDDKLTETAKFTHVWKEENGAWKIARVLSYDHRLAE